MTIPTEPSGSIPRPHASTTRDAAFAKLRAQVPVIALAAEELGV